MKILLFGASGMLGNYIYKYFKDICIPIYRNDLPLLNYNILFTIFRKYNIDNTFIVINCIGLIPQTRNNTFTDYIHINSVFPHILASICKEHNCIMIQPTTDCVYDGLKGNYDENDNKNETNIYGSSKSCGEPEYATVIRTSIIGEEMNHKYSLLEFAKKNKGNTIEGYINHYWNGITCLQYCHIIKYMIDNNYFWKGVRHLYSPNIVSKYDLLNIINDIYKLELNIVPIQKGNNIDKTLLSIYDTSKFFKIPILEQQIKDMYGFNIY